MIRFTKGNILESHAEALVNTVNTRGVMGKGVALQFKKAFPNNFKAYEKACRAGEVVIGKMFVTRDTNLTSGEKLVINFPTKDDWRKPSEYSFIEKGLRDLKRVVEQYQLRSIAIPPLGAGNGGLDWQKVKIMMEDALKPLEAEILVYEPNVAIAEQLKKERVKLTDARALLLYVLYDLVGNGEMVSEFSSEKVCYFLQRFGAEPVFKLDFSPKFYGPYSGKVRFLLNTLNGSYIKGFSDMNARPFDPLTLVADGYNEVCGYLQQKGELMKIAEKTTSFLSGFYADFSLELLSSIDYLAHAHRTLDEKEIIALLERWNTRKSQLFANPQYVKLAVKHLKSNLHADTVKQIRV